MGNGESVAWENCHTCALARPNEAMLVFKRYRCTTDVTLSSGSSYVASRDSSRLQSFDLRAEQIKVIEVAYADESLNLDIGKFPRNC